MRLSRLTANGHKILLDQDGYYQTCPPGVVHAELKAGRATGARLICITDPDYPASLRDIPDPPPMLWVMGDLAILSRPAIALVGARNASSLGTRMAKALGREVLAVPGHPFDARASGCNMLIRDGAILVRSGADVIDALPAETRIEQTQPTFDLSDVPAAARETRSLSETADLHSQILSRLGPSPVAEDQLIRDLGSPAHTVTPALVDLELDGRIRRNAGGLLSLAPKLQAVN